MALSKEQIDILADNYIVSLYDGLEQEVINDIARRINKTGRYTETAEIQARNLRDLGYSTVDIQTEVMKLVTSDPEYKKEIAENTREYKQEVKELIKEIEAEALANGDDMIAAAGSMAWNDDLQMWNAHNINLGDPSTVSQLQKAFAAQTRSNLKNITQTTAFIGTTFGNTGVMNAYQRAMDMTLLKVATGTFSYQQAVTDIIKDLSRSFGTIDYASGRKYHIDTAARMIARTACSQLAGKITEANCEATDCELVYVDAHPGARPEHAAWQGKVFTYKGKPSRKYPDFFKVTEYGSVTGLKGINCTHNYYPYWEGDPVPGFKEPGPVKVDGKDYTYYEATQKQRAMERQIREAKREIKALKATKDPAHEAAIKEKTEKLRQSQQKYADFSKKAGMEPQANRLRVYDSIKAAKQASINSPIQKRQEGIGQAGSIVFNGAPLTKRQKKIDSIVTERGKFYSFKKKEVSMTDLAALTAANNNEYAMFTYKGERLIIRGSEVQIVNFTESTARTLASQGYRWSGHTHPGQTYDTRQSSGGDVAILEIFNKANGQKKSMIINSVGNWGMVKL